MPVVSCWYFLVYHLNALVAGNLSVEPVEESVGVVQVITRQPVAVESHQALKLITGSEYEAQATTEQNIDPELSPSR